MAIRPKRFRMPQLKVQNPDFRRNLEPSEPSLQRAIDPLDQGRPLRTFARFKS
jgi:hypothetical protein